MYTTVWGRSGIQIETNEEDKEDWKRDAQTSQTYSTASIWWEKLLSKNTKKKLMKMREYFCHVYSSLNLL